MLQKLSAKRRLRLLSQRAPATDEAHYTSLMLIRDADRPEKEGHDFTRILRRSGNWLLASDIIALMLAFICGGLCAWAADRVFLRGSFQPLFSAATVKEAIIFSGLGGCALLWLDLRQHYHQRLPFWESVAHILSVTVAGFLVCGFIQFAAQGSFSRLWLALSWSLFGVFLFTGRAVVRRWLDARGQWRIPAVVIGTGEAAQAFIHALTREPEMGFTILRQMPADAVHALVKPHAWKQLMLASGAHHIFIALEGAEMERQQASLKALMRERLPCSVIPPWAGLHFATLSPHHFMLCDALLLHDTNRLGLRLPRLLKRTFDIMVASLLLLIASPVFLLVGALVRLDGGPAFFTQIRVGRNGRHFLCYKFRSMHQDAQALFDDYLVRHPQPAEEWRDFQKLKHDVRITKLGAFIRRKSIDELPQLINVIKGDMSLVGPRPILPQQEPYYADDFLYYENVRPGITGPWQVSGRNRLTFKERVALETSYARNWSLWLDIVILLKTVPTLLKKDESF